MTAANKSVRLVSPLFIPPGELLAATSDLTFSEVGALMILATAWWPEARLPEGAELGRYLGIRTSRAEALMPVLRPFFERGGMFAMLRTAALAKRARRARAGRKGAAALHRKVERAERRIPPRRT